MRSIHFRNNNYLFGSGCFPIAFNVTFERNTSKYSFLKLLHNNLISFGAPMYLPAQNI